MEDVTYSKIFPDGSWVAINLSEMARVLQAANPGKKIITTGKEPNQEDAFKVEKATRDKIRAGTL